MKVFLICWAIGTALALVREFATGRLLREMKTGACGGLAITLPISGLLRGLIFWVVFSLLTHAFG